MATARELERQTERTAERVPTSVRSLYVLEVLAEAGVPMTPTEINDVLRLPKPTIHRVCQRLEAEGFLTKDIDGRRYVPGARLRGMATGLTTFLNFKQARHAVLKRLSETIGETCNITIPAEEGMQYLDRVETRWPLRVHFTVGECVPFHCTASGKLYLASLPAAHRERLLKSLRLEKFATNTITDADRLLELTSEPGAADVGRDNEELVDGMVAIAVPIRDSYDRLVATLALHAPTQRMSLDDALGYIDELRAAASDIRETFVDPNVD